MKHKRFIIEQTVAILKQAETGVPPAELIREVKEDTWLKW